MLRRPAQRTVFDTFLSAEELRDLVRDLCTGATHVQKVAAHLLPQLGSDETISLSEFIGARPSQALLQAYIL